MKKELIVEAQKIEQAIQILCDHFDVSEEEIEIEVIEQPKKSFFGFKTRPAKVKGIYIPSKEEQAIAHLEQILTHMGAENFSLNCETINSILWINIQSEEDLTFIIGRKGEVLDSIQYVINMMLNVDRSEKYVRVMIDFNGYRKNQEKKLIELSMKIGDRVASTGKSATMEPMTSYDRRIVHTAIQERSDIISSSIGKEPNRCVVIKPNKRTE